MVGDKFLFFVNYRHNQSIFALDNLRLNLMRFILWFYFVFGMQLLFAQQEEYRFERLQFLNQKSVSDIRAFCQDPKGYLWIGTGNGLYRFDGMNLKTYRNHPDRKRSIPGNKISALASNGTDRIYILIQEKGLAYYSKQGDGFTLIPADGQKGNFSESAKLATDLRIDHRGNVWVGVEGGGGRWLGLFFACPTQSAFFPTQNE